MLKTLYTTGGTRGKCQKPRTQLKTLGKILGKRKDGLSFPHKCHCFVVLRQLFASPQCAVKAEHWERLNTVGPSLPRHTICCIYIYTQYIYTIYIHCTLSPYQRFISLIKIRLRNIPAADIFPFAGRGPPASLGLYPGKNQGRQYPLQRPVKSTPWPSPIN